MPVSKVSPSGTGDERITTVPVGWCSGSTWCERLLFACHDGDSTPLFGCCVGERLVERPLGPPWVLSGVLPLAVVEVRWLHEDASAVGAGVFAVGSRVVHTHHHRMRDFAPAWWPAIMSHIANDDRSLTKAELRAVVLADPYALDESKCLGQPVDSVSYIRVDENRDNRGGRDRAVWLHALPAYVERSSMQNSAPVTTPFRPSPTALIDGTGAPSRTAPTADNCTTYRYSEDSIGRRLLLLVPNH